MDSELLKDILITAVEGGSNYWAEFKNYCPDRGTVELKDVEGDQPKEWVKVDIDIIELGINRIASGKIEHLANCYIGTCHLMRVKADEADFDANDADIILQAGLFNEIIYG